MVLTTQEWPPAGTRGPASPIFMGGRCIYICSFTAHSFICPCILSLTQPAHWAYQQDPSGAEARPNS